ncbi:MAG TPA: hypothetical protein VFM16_04750 [Holophagaceae bacterium]|nr:hypothetical protein [Holophagaceae bacterium]
MLYVSLRNVLKVALGIGVILLVELASMEADRAFPGLKWISTLLGWPVFLVYLAVGFWQSVFLPGDPGEDTGAPR